MKTTLFSLALAFLGVTANPTRRAIDDDTVLNFALTLEYLEADFYAGALKKFNAQAFAAAGFPAWVHGRFVEIGQHESAHVEFLQKALGSKAAQKCSYSFPYTDPKSFAALSQVLEGVGVSAYAGAAQFIKNPDYLTAAASILPTEARHASWIAAAVNSFSPWSGPFDVNQALKFVLQQPQLTIFYLGSSRIELSLSSRRSLHRSWFLPFYESLVPCQSVPILII